MVENFLPINTGTVQAPYQEFTYKIAPHSSVKVDYVTRTLVLLSVSEPSVLKVNFGGAANETPFTQGLQYTLANPVQYVRLFNTGNTELTVSFSLGTGEIRDSRLNFTGTVFVSNSNETALSTIEKQYSLIDSTEFTISGGSVSLDPAGAIKTRIQNTGSSPVRLYSSAGSILAPLGVEDLTLSAAFSIYGANGAKVVFERFS